MLAPVEGRGFVFLIFGDRYSRLLRLLSVRGWKVVNPISRVTVSPFAVVGEPDRRLVDLLDDNAPLALRMNVEKNIGPYFESSGANHFIFDATSCLVPLVEYQGRYYSANTSDVGQLVTRQASDDASALEPFDFEPFDPSSSDFAQCWRSLFEEFVDVVRANFPSDQILTLRAHITPFRNSAEGICLGEEAESVLVRRSFVEAIEDYFIEATHCRVVDGRSTRLLGALDGSAGSDPVLLRCLEREVKTAALGRPSPESFSASKDSTFEDVLAALYLVERGALSAHKVARAVIENPDGMLMRESRQLLSRNLDLLSSSGCGSPEVLALVRDRIAALDLGGHRHAVFDDDGITMVRQQFEHRSSEDWKKTVVLADSIIRPGEIELALHSWEFYLERARQGVRLSVPVEFSDSREAIRFLCTLDLEEVFEHELFYFYIRGEAVDTARAMSKIDLAPLVSESTRILSVGGGISDQLSSFSWLYATLKDTPLNLYVDDLQFDQMSTHNGLEIDAVCPNFSERRYFSRILSEPMRWRAMLSPSLDRVAFGRVAPLLQHLSSGRIIVMPVRGAALPGHTSDSIASSHYRDSFVLADTSGEGRALLHAVWEAPVVVRAINSHIGVFDEKRSWEENFVLSPTIKSSFDGLVQDQNAIGVHVRRGDRLRDVNNQKMLDEGYSLAMAEALRRHQVDETTRTPVLVFSDDLAYCKSHAAELGLSAPGVDLHYVDGHRHFLSLTDMYLLSRCRTVIGATGAFARTAVLISPVVHDYTMVCEGHLEIWTFDEARRASRTRVGHGSAVEGP